LAEDPYNLKRFIDAQEPLFDRVCLELRNGRKASHWMWFIFPQFKGLGQSATAKRFEIASRNEAVAYAKHPILGPRLTECTRLVNAIEGSSAAEIFGYPDDLKFCSCMTLFAHVCGNLPEFLEAIEKYFAGEFDSLTVDRL
jgi:uncharacterized protein (DUF1810 family)